MQGRDDSPLTPEGVEDATRLGAFASGLRIRGILTSPLGRAQATARVVAAAVHCRVQVRDELTEINFGLCCGLTLEASYRAFPGLRAARAEDRWNHPWPGGESYAQVVERLGTLLPDLAKRGDLLVIAHQCVNRALLHALIGLPPEQALAGEQPSDCVIRVDPEGCSHVRIAEGDPSVPVDWRPGLFQPKAA
jgi:probable phosphoglycerate mutase